MDQNASIPRLHGLVGSAAVLKTPISIKSISEDPRALPRQEGGSTDAQNCLPCVLIPVLTCDNEWASDRAGDTPYRSQSVEGVLQIILPERMPDGVPPEFIARCSYIAAAISVQSNHA